MKGCEKAEKGLICLRVKHWLFFPVSSFNLLSPHFCYQGKKFEYDSVNVNNWNQFGTCCDDIWLWRLQGGRSR